ncbi:hypothetical protein B8V81_4434 [Paenibacillus pasadenensis]|uniref:Uncharacterized protein n=1 Tax=Paenibacillus pasadenensis TaxID=217090 RepID=A0A2N5N6R6_9BACL|nr:hypothetical protein B8V81_4434 [Paenibacillus pasadenensis]
MNPCSDHGGHPFFLAASRHPHMKRLHIGDEKILAEPGAFR